MMVQAVAVVVTAWSIEVVAEAEIVVSVSMVFEIVVGAVVAAAKVVSHAVLDR
jgi:hypothetical protein